MKYEARQASIHYPETDYERDFLEETHNRTEEQLEDDEIADWEEAFLNGYAEA